MKKNESANMKSMTKLELLTALNEAAETYNKSHDDSVKAHLEVQAKGMMEQYNALAKLDVYAEVLETELPLAELIKKHHYSTIGVKYALNDDVVDGKLVSRKVASVVSGKKNIDMFDFIKWAEACNKKVAATDDWKSTLKAQQKLINAAFKKSVSHESNYSVSKTLANNVLKAVFDALVFIPSENGLNSVLPNKDCKNLIITCAAEYKETIADDDDVDVSLDFFKDKRWQSTIQSTLYIVLKNKTLTYSFGEEEPDTKKAKTTTEATTETDNK